MVKVECPGHKQLKPFTLGTYLNGYYYLLDNVNERLLKVKVEPGTDAVIMTCDNNNNYLFYDENLEPVQVEHSLKGSVDLPPASYKSHKICTAQTVTGNYIIVTSFHEAGSGGVGVQLFNQDLEVLREHNIELAQGVAWNEHNRVLVLLTSGGGSTIAIFEIDYEPNIPRNPNIFYDPNLKLNHLATDGIFGWDKRECLYLNNYLWIVDNSYRQLEKRATNYLAYPLPTSLHNIVLSVDSGDVESRLYKYHGNILIVNRTHASFDNCKFRLFEPSTGAQLISKYLRYKPPSVITVKDDYIYFVKVNGDLCQMNENLEVINTVYPNLIGLVALI